MSCLLTPETVGKKNWTAKFSGEEGFPAQRENHSAPKLESSWRECVYDDILPKATFVFQWEPKSKIEMIKIK